MAQAHLASRSPFRHRQVVRNVPLLDPPREKLKTRENGFRLDCVHVEKLRYRWSTDVIPHYDASKDVYARPYFESPMVKSLLRRTASKPNESAGCYKSLGTCKLSGRLEVTPKSLRQLPADLDPSPTRPRERQRATPASRPSPNSLSFRRRAPATPPGSNLEERRRNFRIDGVMATNAATKERPIVRRYDAKEDRHSIDYFKKPGVRRMLALTLGGAVEKYSKHKDEGGSSIDGPVIDKFIESGAGYRYLNARNEAPGAARAGHSIDQISGHGQFMSDVKPNFGFNGKYGYRRNSPWLRKMPSAFGVDPRSPTH